jgi:hypothetical protein
MNSKLTEKEIFRKYAANEIGWRKACSDLNIFSYDEFIKKFKKENLKKKKLDNKHQQKEFLKILKG